jgi:hypothetical protein
MKKNMSKPSEKIDLLRIILICILTLMLFLVSCVNAKETRSTILNTAKPTVTLTITPTKNQPTKTPTPTTILPTETPTVTPNRYLNDMTLVSTQGAVFVTTHESPNNTYLYKYANVTILSEMRDETNFLNLDDLSDNGFSNSDIAFNYAKPLFDVFYLLNGSTYYYSDRHGMNYDSCMEHFPFTNMDIEKYYMNTKFLGAGTDLCVLTSDGRLSIIRFDQFSYFSDYYKNSTVSFVVTTYKQIVPQVLTPQPTATSGPSPTPGRYSGMNLTLKEEATLDKSAQNFIDAVTAYDKVKVAEMIDYPISLDYKDDFTETYAYSKEEFIAVYDEIFTRDFVNEIKNATIAENMGNHYIISLSLSLENGDIYFSPDGKIHGITKTIDNSN